VKENKIIGSGDRPNTNQLNSIMASINDHTIGLVLKAEVKIMYIVVMTLQVFDHYLVDANLKIHDVGCSGLVRSISVQRTEVEDVSTSATSQIVNAIGKSVIGLAGVRISSD